MHWLHSLDQMVYRIGGACFTYNEFARALYELREDRRHAMASAFAESKRSESRQEISYEVLKDSNEKSTNILRSQATLLEEASRHILAQPALDAARIELFTIESLIDFVSRHVTGSVPFAFYSAQRIESSLALHWKSFIELRTYGQLSGETLSEFLSRGINPPDASTYQSVAGRDDFLTFHDDLTGDLLPLLQTDLDNLYNATIGLIEKSPLMLAYQQTLLASDQDEGFCGILPASKRTIDAATGGQGSGSFLPSLPKRG